VSHSTSGFGPPPEADPPSSHRGLGSHPPAPDGYGGYQVSPYGAPHGLRPIPRQLRPPPESSGNSFAGVFLTLIIIAVVLVGTVGLGKGLVRLNLVGSDPTNASSYQDSDPVAARPVSGARSVPRWSTSPPSSLRRTRSVRAPGSCSLPTARS
jgi:hypothetical protein